MEWKGGDQTRHGCEPETEVRVESCFVEGGDQRVELRHPRDLGPTIQCHDDDDDDGDDGNDSV